MSSAPRAQTEAFLYPTDEQRQAESDAYVAAVRRGDMDYADSALYKLGVRDAARKSFEGNMAGAVKHVKATRKNMRYMILAAFGVVVLLMIAGIIYAALG